MEFERNDLALFIGQVLVKSGKHRAEVLERYRSRRSERSSRDSLIPSPGGWVASQPCLTTNQIALDELSGSSSSSSLW